MGQPRSTDSMDYRLGALERDVRGVSQSLTNLTLTIENVMKDVRSIEEWRIEQRVEAAGNQARQEERDKALAKSLESITASIGSVKSDIAAGKGTWGKLAWSIVQPVILVIVTFGLAGGFRNLPIP